MRAREEYERWLEHLPKRDPLHSELLRMRGKEDWIEECFCQNIAFGTAGLRGICGAGTNRMNVLTVGRATRGIANYILAYDQEHPQENVRERGVAIAYDCRYHSREFSQLAAEILKANGIRAYLFPSLRPTPELSFAIRRLSCVAGINMTASHNPKEYNGYKVYWMDGAQISGSVSEGMQDAIEALDFFDDFCKPERDLPEEEIEILGEEMDQEYLSYVKSLYRKKEEELDRSVSIIYTPLNGAGNVPVQKLAKERGFVNFFLVPEQADPDPEFTTVGYPNPEDPRGFAYAEDWGKRRGAQLLIATDPDADRMAIELLGSDGGYHFINGNQTGALLIDYLASTLPERRQRGYGMIKSIVTSDMGAAICRAHDIEVFEALTGFKNICGRIPDLEERGLSYFFGYEESIGCAPGDAVRDKDGIAATMLLAEMCAFYAKQGKSLGQRLEELYQIYGYFKEKPLSLVLEGQDGARRIGRIMDVFRRSHWESFGGLTLKKRIDYSQGYEDIPPSDVLKYELADRCWFAIRPSGTEPKLKVYCYSWDRQEALASEKLERMRYAIEQILEDID